MKRASKTLKTAHTSNKKIGMGDFYGSAIPNPVGRIRDGFNERAIKPKRLKKPPKSLA